VEPFFSGMAIGLVILIPLVILIFVGRVLFLIGIFICAFVGAAHNSWVKYRASSKAVASREGVSTK
jgi:hypothetical protein